MTIDLSEIERKKKCISLNLARNKKISKRKGK